jgi:MFS family permease
MWVLFRRVRRKNSLSRQAGSCCGLLVGSWVMDKWGRKAGVVYAAVLGIIGTVGVTSAQNVAMFIAFRFFCGVGTNAFMGVTGVVRP